MLRTRNLGRYREIAAVLARHGFGWLLAELKLRDLLPMLQDDAPAVPYPQVAAVFEAELGAPLEQYFEEFDPAPLASASIGQVHAARLPGGEEVVVKVQHWGEPRWGARETVEV